MINSTSSVLNSSHFTPPILYINHFFYHRCTVNLIHTYHTNFILNCCTVIPDFFTNRHGIQYWCHPVTNSSINVIQLLWCQKVLISSSHCDIRKYWCHPVIVMSQTLVLMTSSHCDVTNSSINVIQSLWCQNVLISASHCDVTNNSIDVIQSLWCQK